MTARGRAAQARAQRKKRRPKYDHLETPPHLLDAVRRVGEIGLDPTSNVRSGAYRLARVAWNRHALSRSWSGYGLVFCNPPYSGQNLSLFTAKMREDGDEVIGLVPASVEAQWWRDNVWQAANAVCFVYGRVVFYLHGKPVTDGKGRPMCAWFASAFVYYGTRFSTFRRAFGRLGYVVRLPACV